MKYKRLTAVLSLMLTAILFTGCKNEAPKPQAVVIDLPAVSEAAGIDELTKKYTETMNQQISEEIKALSAELSKQLEDEKAALGDNPSEEDDKKIQTLREQLRKQIQRARFAANDKLVKEKSKIWRSFLDDLTPVARQTALDHGASIILKSRAAVFWSDKSVDITHEVIGRMADRRHTESTDKQQN